MDLNLESNLNLYKNNSQKARVFTENWVSKNIFCPICGNLVLEQYTANKPVADFFCPFCKSDYELKSKSSTGDSVGKKIVDGAYSTMIERITSKKNPNFFFMTYHQNKVTNFFLIPNHFFTPNIIEKRRPLSDTARRAGWVGCNIMINLIPETCKIYIVKRNNPIDKNEILNQYQTIKNLKTDNLKTRGWMLDVINCIDAISADSFSLNDIYQFTRELSTKHPNNKHIKDKIRQQLQFLRDKDFLAFTSRGHYKKLLSSEKV